MLDGSLDNTVAGHMLDDDGQLIVMIEFDLSVVVHAKIEGEAEAKLEVFSYSLGGGKITTIRLLVPQHQLVTAIG